MIYACVRNGVVENTIVADEMFVAAVAPNWDHVVRIDELDPQPGIGWTYDGENFTAPVVEEPPEEP